MCCDLAATEKGIPPQMNANNKNATSLFQAASTGSFQGSEQEFDKAALIPGPRKVLFFSHR